MKQGRFEILLATVNRFVRPPIDAENIAAELWMEESTNGKHHTLTSVKNRCIDALRNEKVRNEYEKASTDGYFGRHENVQKHVDLQLLAQAFHDAGFDITTRNIIYRRFWRGESLLQISIGLQIGLNETRVRYREALSSLREVFKKEEQ